MSADTKTGGAAAACRPTRLLHVMLRVSDLARSLHFYTEALGMHLLRREDYPTGRFTLAFVGYGDEARHTVLELTHNWDARVYEPGTSFGHLALAVVDVHAAAAALQAAGAPLLRSPGPLTHLPSHGGPPDVIAFVADPDGNRIELVQA